MKALVTMTVRAGLALALMACMACACAQVPVPGKQKPAAGDAGITGAGSSFVYPLMNKWATAYFEKNKVRVNYQSIGSGGGIKQFTAQLVDFAATDAPMSEEELKQAGEGVLHIPVTMGAVAVTYNVPGVDKPLVLSGDVLAKIFTGSIRKWNDAAIASLNSGARLPDADIVVVHRSDGSGTTYIFSDYLSKASAAWKQTVGTGKSLNWPAGIGGKGNEGVAALVSRTPNAIGYVEVIYAMQTKMPIARIQNAAGEIVDPGLEQVTAAAAELTSIPDDLRLSITNAPGKQAYPITGVVWVLARTSSTKPGVGMSLNSFLTWILSDEGQAMAAPLNYSKLPPALLEKARAKAAQVK